MGTSLWGLNCSYRFDDDPGWQDGVPGSPFLVHTTGALELGRQQPVSPMQTAEIVVLELDHLEAHP
jgi:hypothetical protein